MSIQSATSPGRESAIFAMVLVGSTFLLATSFVAGRVLVLKVDPLPLVGWRFLLAAIATLPLAIWEIRRAGGVGLGALLPRRDQVWVVLLVGLLQTGLVMGLLFYAIQRLGAPTAAIILFTNPIWVGLAAPWILGDRLTPALMIGLVIGISGVALALGLGQGVIGTDPVGYLAALGASVTWSTSTLLQKRIGIHLPPFTMASWQMFIGSLALLVAAFVSGSPWIGALQGVDWLTFLWLSVPGSVGAFGLWSVALATGGAARASGFLFLTPAFVVLLSGLILGTAITPSQMIGGVMIGLSIWLINRP